MTRNSTISTPNDAEDKNQSKRMNSFENEFATQEVSQHKLSLSPTLSSRFKRKGNFSPIDLNDNYHAQKRHISEAMAIQMGQLSLDGSSKAGNFFPSSTSSPPNFLHINEIPRSNSSRPSIEALNAKINAPSFTVNSNQPFTFTPPSSPSKKVDFIAESNRGNINFTSNNEENATNNKNRVFNGLRRTLSKTPSQLQFTSNNNNNNNNNNNVTKDPEERLRDFRKMRSKSLSANIKSAFFTDPFPELRGLQTDYNKALVLYKSPSDVILGGLPRNSAKSSPESGMEVENKEENNNQMAM
eukprot:TRINITY_DN1503_c1_g1_i1.p1 TRINITY_DN1503_c1_g1~~TRINITY_DN1503_c1_g1_i1.p1  ORF type:complete len:310 (-),score=87.11 TRINITY_DN1503_c1_g1_i1:57-953(-)